MFKIMALNETREALIMVIFVLNRRCITQNACLLTRLIQFHHLLLSLSATITVPVIILYRDMNFLGCLFGVVGKVEIIIDNCI
jgi:hypothetical protein